MSQILFPYWVTLPTLIFPTIKLFFFLLVIFPLHTNCISLSAWKTYSFASLFSCCFPLLCTYFLFPILLAKHGVPNSNSHLSITPASSPQKKVLPPVFLLFKWFGLVVLQQHLDLIFHPRPLQSSYYTNIAVYLISSYETLFFLSLNFSSFGQGQGHSLTL